MRNSRDRYFGGRGKENTFYTKPNNGGIIKKSLPGIDEIKQSIEAAERRAKTYENEWLDSVVNNADTRQIEAAKARMVQAKSSVVSLNEQLSDAYGLGEDGYWNNQRTARSVQMGNNPDHAYAIGNSTTAAAKPQSAYAAGTKAATAQPKTQGQTAAQNTLNTSAASRRMELDIAQLQDEIVNGQDLSDYKKGQLNDKLAKLVSQKEVLDWENTKTTQPTQEDYQRQINYLNSQINKVQDDFVHAYADSDKIQMGDESWQNYHNTVNNLVEKRDAFNMGMMGMIGGGAQDASANANLGGGGKGTVSLDADDARMYTGQPGVDDGEEESVPQSVFPSQSKPSREEELKTNIEDTYAKILGMTESEKTNFMETAEGRSYTDNLKALEGLIGILAYEQYWEELLGGDNDAKNEGPYTGGTKQGMDDGEERVSQSVFPSQKKPSREDELKTKIEDTYAKILGMTESEKTNFMETAEGQSYTDNLKALEGLIGILAYEQYWKKLLGKDKGSGVSITDISLEDIFDRGMPEIPGGEKLETRDQEKKTEEIATLSPEPGPPPLPQVIVDLDGYIADINNIDWIDIDFVSDTDKLRDLYGDISDGILISDDYAFRLGTGDNPNADIERIQMPEINSENIWYYLEVVMNKPLEELTPEELKWRQQAEKNEVWKKIQDAMEIDLNDGLETYKENHYTYYTDYYLNANDKTKDLIIGLIYGQNSSIDYSDEKIAQAYAEYLWNENVLEEKYIQSIKKSYEQEYNNAIKIINNGFKPYFEMAIEIEKKEDSKVELKGPRVILTNFSNANGEILYEETKYLSIDEAKLLVNPDYIYEISESYGITKEDLVSYGVRGINKVSKVALKKALSNEKLIAKLGAQTLEGLQLLSTLINVYITEVELITKLDYLPKIEQEIEKCEPGDYITIYSAGSSGTNWNYFISHTSNDYIYTYNLDGWKVKYEE